MKNSNNLIFETETKPEWNFRSSDKKYSTHITIFNNNIVHLDVIGTVNEENLEEVWGKVEKILFEKFNHQKYFLVHNYQELENASISSRNKYIHWVKDNLDNIETIYFYNVSPLFKTIIKAGKLLSHRLNNTFIYDSFDQVIKSIYNQTNNTSSILEDHFWEINNVFYNNGTKYITKQKWTYTHSTSRSKYETFLINNNIFIRRFYGILEDGTMSEIESSFELILKELALMGKPYHFFIDFSNVESMTLSYRKEGLQWFLKNKELLITSGFFNLTTLLKIQLKITRSLFPFTHFVKRVFILDHLEEVFSNIEHPNYINNEKLLFSKDNYKDFSKEELVSEITDLHQKISFLENERTTEIQNIYNKLGRVTWDESYNFTEESIDLSNNPYADVHNAVFIVQKDIKEILSKRDLLIKKANESERLKSAFLSNMSHEIRTPMNSILGFTGILLEQIKDENQYRFLSIIDRSSKHLLSIINDILDISKIQSGDFKLIYEPFDIDKLLFAIIEEQQINIRDKNIELFVSNNNSIMLNADQLRIKQILINLISNAIKFTDEGSIEVGYNIKENFIEFFVKDTGKGINISDQKFVFDRFRQVDESITRQYEGTGLGLSIIKSLVELHGGSVQLESKVNKGSTFSFTIPIIESLESNQEKENSKSNGLLEISNKTILIAEDQIENFIYLETLLNKNNNTLINTQTGKETIDTFKTFQIDLILMDIQMPDMDGYTCTKAIRTINSSVPIIAQTAYSTESDKEKALASGCDDYISKPINKYELFEKLNRLLIS